MKASKMTWIAALAVGGMLTLSSALFAADTNTTSSSTPPAGAPPGGGMRNRGPSLDAIATQLSLTDDQKAKVKTVLDDRNQQMMDLRNETDPDTRRSKMQALRTDTNTKMKAILTDDQYAKWEKMSAGMRGPRGARNGNTNAPAATPPPQN